MKRTLPLLLLLATALCSCNLRPLYNSGIRGGAAQTLSEVTVAPIAGKSGWLMHNALNDRISAAPKATAKFRLEVELDDQITGFGTRADNSTTRERRTLRARFRLIETANNSVVLDATAGSDAGIDVVSSEYATIAAEDTALDNLTQVVADQIVTRIALFAQRTRTSP